MRAITACEAVTTHKCRRRHITVTQRSYNRGLFLCAVCAWVVCTAQEWDPKDAAPPPTPEIDTLVLLDRSVDT
eukprot:19425-Heterococcus_DN1.PRE.3